MDAATEFTQKLGVASLKKFMVSGASKVISKKKIKFCTLKINDFL